MPFYNTFTMLKTFLRQRKRLNLLILWLCERLPNKNHFFAGDRKQKYLYNLITNYNLPLAIKNYHGKFSISSDGSVDIEPVRTGDKA